MANSKPEDLKKKPVTYTLTPTTIDRLKKLSSERHMSQSTCLEQLIWNTKLKSEEHS